jgi:hypothetical protein
MPAIWRRFWGSQRNRGQPSHLITLLLVSPARFHPASVEIMRIYAIDIGQQLGPTLGIVPCWSTDD